jgi:sulfur-oxidizing protein SoxB
MPGLFPPSKHLLFRVAFMEVLLAAASLSVLLPAANVRRVRILHIADTHAQLDTHWEYLPEDPSHLHQMGGFARIRTALDEARAQAPGAVFTVDGGDTFQGSAIAAWTKGEAVIAPFNALQTDVGTPGNWEPVYGPDIFRKLMGELSEKLICYNFHEKATGKRLFAPSVVLERRGIKIAFVGLTDPTTTTRQAPAEVAGLDSTRIDGLREYVRDLKKREKPDLTVLVDHTGLAPSVQLAHNIPEFDIVLSGHTHERVYKPILVGKTIVVEPGSMGSFFGQLDLTLKNGDIDSYQYRLVGIDAATYPENPDVKAMIQKAELPFFERLREVVGQTTAPLLRYDVLESSMDNVIADAVKEAGHADIGLTNGFRFSPPVAAGPITEADLWNMLPFNARLKSGKASGQQIRTYLEHEMELVFSRDPFGLSGGWGPRPSGMTIVFTAGAPHSQRIRDVRIGTAELDPNRTLTIGGCEREGEPINVICRLQGVQDPDYVPGTIHSVLKTYLRVHSPITSKREGRVRATDLPRVVWSQYGVLQKLWNIPGDVAGVAVPGKMH